MTSIHHKPGHKKEKKQVSSSTYSKLNTIDEAGKESFPSSDPPAWTLGAEDRVLAGKLKDKHRDLGWILTQEHVVIRKVSHTLDHLIAALEKGEVMDMTKLKAISQFFLEYVDNCHHKKEELIFAALRKKGNERPTNYVLDDLLSEHKYGKKLHGDLEKALAMYAKDKTAGAQAVVVVLKDMHSLHHNHTSKEEEYVFPHINTVLDKNQLDTFLGEFTKLDDKLGANKHAELTAFAEQLAKEARK